MTSDTGSSRVSLFFKVLLPCFVGQNLATGFAFGTFGPLLEATETQFEVSRTFASMGMSFLYLAVGMIAPVMGGMLRKVSLRLTMVAGAALSTLGYLGLALAPSFWIALLMYPLVGAGVAILTVLGPVTLILRHYTGARGRALSIVNLPIAISLAPFLVGLFLPELGRITILLMMAATFAGATLLMTVVDEGPAARPAEETPRAAEEDRAEAPSEAKPRPTTLLFFKSPTFWVFSSCLGLLAGAGSVFAVHIVPFATERGMSIEAAAGLMTISTSVGMLGSILFGWTVDKFGAVISLFASALIYAFLWFILFYASPSALFVVAALMGVVIVPVLTLQGAACAEIFGAENVSQAMGLSYTLKLPFVLLGVPLASVIYETTGSYHVAFSGLGMLLLVASCCFLVIYLSIRRGSSFAAGRSGIVTETARS